MRKGYLCLDAVWPSISDCEEMALSQYEEEVYIYGLRRIADHPEDWKRRVDGFEQRLKKQPYHVWQEITIMD